MCCFSRRVEKVWSTRIFARPLEAARQMLVYGMTFDASEDLAMILPIPVPPDSPDDAVRFIDLSACPTFFDDLSGLFPVVHPPSFGGLDAPRAAAQSANLVVHDVGDFEASFVPAPRDFDRLDSRFRLPAEVWDALPAYADWGFCVFKLRTASRGGLFGLFKSSRARSAAAGGRTPHPMAFDFPRRDTSGLFFPTVHVHDGLVHPTAHFDHELYCQVQPELEALVDWPRSAWTTERLAPRAHPWVKPNAWMWKQTLSGDLPNRDTYLFESRLRSRTVVDGSFRLRMQARYEQLIDDGRTPLAANVRKWMRVSEAERVRIRDAVVARLSVVLAEHAHEWGLTRFSLELPEIQPHVPVMIPAAACYATFHAESERVESQELDVAFERPPAEGTRALVAAAFQDAMDRATR